MWEYFYIHNNKDHFLDNINNISQYYDVCKKYILIFHFLFNKFIFLQKKRKEKRSGDGLYCMDRKGA